MGGARRLGFPDVGPFQAMSSRSQTDRQTNRHFHQGIQAADWQLVKVVSCIQLSLFSDL